jgi:cytochrome c556
MIKGWNKAVAACVAIGLGTCGAFAAGPDIAGVIKARKGNYKEIGGAFKSINDELKTGAPDMNSLRPIARDLASRAAFSLKHFPKGSGPESKQPTRAKAAIWSNQGEFNAIQQQMVEAAKALNAAAAAGNLAGMQSARTKLGATCKSCHDKFREPA